MEFASVEWYGMVWETILAVFREHGVTPITDTIAKSWHIAREEGGNVDTLRAYVESLQPTPPVPPPVPSLTREQVCAVKLTFQGLTVHTDQFGDLPWFDPALFALSPSDRQKVYAAKKAAGDTHAILGFDDQQGSLYDEPGQPYQQMNAYNFENHPDAFKAAILEVLAARFVPIVFLGGDDGEVGYPLAVRQLPKVVQWLKDINCEKNALIIPGWDGVFYGWTPDHIAAFGQQFRTINPNGCLGIEHQPGRIPIGNGPADWGNGGPMQTYDVLLTEFHDGHLREDSTWQVAGRTLGPAYRRDPQQQGDTNPPFYLGPGTPRGPYYAIAFEYAEYEWVRALVSKSSIDTDRAYLKSLGYIHVC